METLNVTMRLYIKRETEKAYLVESTSFSEKWLPKSQVKCNKDKARMGMLGISYEFVIPYWLIQVNNIDEIS